ncbi:probable selenium-dependent hydroxylase accessory protein YqeC [Desulforhopalus singaporensis]|uniref:Probable selenium-dependent hydroxylase accessory protein YqeC n=2 Tax=Desulforhopalus singaporensis TaxID=91360 RepID=A0A1H0K0E6_9BACT|nr:probable selenium-dependent hydroxylase accessory protein YqeC [Desulforhopalus singaporensis]
MVTTKGAQFLDCFGLATGPGRLIVALVGAGGKTSLMLRLAAEGKALGKKVLVTTTTRIFVPPPSCYDEIDLEGTLFGGSPRAGAGVFVAGVLDPQLVGQDKIKGCDLQLLARRVSQFDLVLIEADGSAKRALKGWRKTEPVVPQFATHTVGVVDIQSVGQPVSDQLVHRLQIFTELTGAAEGDLVSVHHLKKMIESDQGLFGKARGEEILYINKVESQQDRENGERLAAIAGGRNVVCGSLHENFCAVIR